MNKAIRSPDHHLHICQKSHHWPSVMKHLSLAARLLVGQWKVVRPRQSVSGQPWDLPSQIVRLSTHPSCCIPLRWSDCFLITNPSRTQLVSSHSGSTVHLVPNLGSSGLNLSLIWCLFTILAHSSSNSFWRIDLYCIWSPLVNWTPSLVSDCLGEKTVANPWLLSKCFLERTQCLRWTAYTSPLPPKPICSLSSAENQTLALHPSK